MDVAKFQASIPGLEVDVPETWALNLRDHRRTSEFKWIRRSCSKVIPNERRDGHSARHTRSISGYLLL